MNQSETDAKIADLCKQRRAALMEFNNIEGNQLRGLAGMKIRRISRELYRLTENPIYL